MREGNIPGDNNHLAGSVFQVWDPEHDSVR